MREHLILRLDAPLMAFGDIKVDKRGVTSDFPGLSMLSGLLGNALGYDHRDSQALSAIQGRLRFAVRRDRLGEKLTDYQTVDLAQTHLADEGWTTRGEAEGRKGSDASEGTHIRLRDYWADSVYTLALYLDPASEDPRLEEVDRALGSPVRPLFLGRKPCLPSAPLVVGRMEADSLVDALRRAPLLAENRRSGGPTMTAWLPAEEPFDGPSRELQVFDERDWVNQIVAGRRLVKQVALPVGEVGDGR